MRTKKKKKKRGNRRKDPAQPVSDVDPALLEAYHEDPIALWQDGEYEALERLYAQPDGDHQDDRAAPGPAAFGESFDSDDEIPF